MLSKDVSESNRSRHTMPEAVQKSQAVELGSEKEILKIGKKQGHECQLNWEFDKKVRKEGTDNPLADDAIAPEIAHHLYS